MIREYQSNISNLKYKWVFILAGCTGGLLPFLFGLIIILSFENSLDIVGSIAFTFGLFVIWTISYEVFIKPSTWSMLIIDQRVIWNTLSGIEYIRIDDIDKMEIFPGRQDEIAIRFRLKNGTVKGVQRDNCRDVIKASYILKQNNENIIIERK